MLYFRSRVLYLDCRGNEIILSRLLRKLPEIFYTNRAAGVKIAGAGLITRNLLQQRVPRQRGGKSKFIPESVKLNGVK